MAKRKNPAAVSLGRRGGRKTLELFGAEHFSNAGKKGGKKSGALLRKKYGPDYFRLIRAGKKPSSL